MYHSPAVSGDIASKQECKTKWPDLKRANVVTAQALCISFKNFISDDFLPSLVLWTYFK